MKKITKPWQNLKTIIAALKTALKEWWKRDPFRESAIIAYYAIFALPGLLVVIGTIAGYFFGREAVNGQMAGQISSIMGAETAQQIEDIIARVSESKKSVWATILGIVTILVGATGVFVQFQTTLNNIWGVKVDESKSGIMSMLNSRLYSFGLILAIAFVLIVSLVISSALAALNTWITNHFSTSFLVIVQLINFTLSLGILASLFALMFKIFPDVKIKWHHVWMGAFLSATLFEIGKFALGIYFVKADPGSGYGAAGSLILILLWVSYSTMIVLYGAEFTHAYSQTEKIEAASLKTDN
jgi:membrane protein